MRNAQLRSCYVTLHIGLGPSRFIEQQLPSPLIVRDGSSPFELSDDIWVERLDEELSKRIQRACEPAEYSTVNQHDRHLYAFVRSTPVAEKYRYEGMSDLKSVIALSRLVNPTSTGDRYCAQVHQFPESNSSVFPILYSGVSPDIIAATDKDRRDWLSIADGEALRNLVPWITKGKDMHPRIHRAYWNHEHALRSYYLDIRWPLIVSGFEALMNTKDRDNSRQFKERVKQLALYFNVSLSDDDLKHAYDLRSKLVHAEGFLVNLASVLPTDEHVPLYQKLESLLRITLLRCLLDENFGYFFKDAAAVDARWPFFTKPKAKSKRRKRP